MNTCADLVADDGSLAQIDRAPVTEMDATECIGCERESLESKRRGGRYDGLVEQLGGPATPGIGFALGVDRILMACEAEDVFPGPQAAADVFLIDLTDGTQSLAVLDELARGGVRVDRSYDNRSVKAQFKAADRSEAPLAVIIGEDEVAAGTAQIKDLVTGDQRSVTRSELLVEIRKLCS